MANFKIWSDPRFFIEFVDYESTNSSGFDLNVNIAFQQIDLSLFELKYLKSVAAVQSDVVAHSMGGDLARYLVTLDSYLQDQNYRHGVVHKLITLDTPHLGSDLASNLYASDSSCKDVYRSHGRPVGDAVRDLIPGSPALTKLLTPLVPLLTHAIAGIASTEQENALTDFFTLDRILRVLCPKLIPAGGVRVLFGGDSDLVVSKDSQEGIFVENINPPPKALSTISFDHVSDVPTTEFRYFVHSVDTTVFIHGPDILSHDVVGGQVVGSVTAVPDEVIDLLNRSVLSSAYGPILP